MALPGVAVPPLEHVIEYLILGFFAVIFLPLVGAWLVEGFVYLWFSIRILKSDTLPIALVASTPGPVEITGTARVADEVVQAPFSGAECLACEYEITKWKGGVNDFAGCEETIYEGRTQTRFYVEDDTASVLVDPAGATFNFDDHETNVFSEKSVPESLRQFLDEHPRYDPNASWWNRSTQRFIERRLEPGEQVHVYGLARYDPTVSKHAGSIDAIIDAPPPRRSLLARLRARVTTPPFVISDTDERAALRRLLADAGFQLGLVVAVILVIVFFL